MKPNILNTASAFAIVVIFTSVFGPMATDDSREAQAAHHVDHTNEDIFIAWGWSEGPVPVSTVAPTNPWPLAGGFTAHEGLTADEGWGA